MRELVAGRRITSPIGAAALDTIAPTCNLIPATIALFRVAAANATAISADVFNLPSDSGSQFRIDRSACQYIYNVNARSLGAGRYRVQISILGVVVGSASFVLQ